MRVARRTARAILIDGNGRLILFRRTLPKRKPYWSTPGGGVDPEDGSIEAALHRELAEELGATVDRTAPVFLSTSPRGDGIAIAHFFVCRLVSMDLAKRTGSEFTNPAKGRYDVERIDLRGKKLARYALTPPEVKEFILANRQALLTTALAADTPPITLPGTRAATAAQSAPEAAAAETGDNGDDDRRPPAGPENNGADSPEALTTAAPATPPAPTAAVPGAGGRGADVAGAAPLPASGPLPATGTAAKPPRPRRRPMPPILEIVDGEVLRDGSDGSDPGGPDQAEPGDGLPRRHRFWPWSR